MDKPLTSLLSAALLLALVPRGFASATWYVNGANGSDTNDCMSTAAACKTIRHAISLAASGDLIKVAPATYKENLIVGKSLTIAGSGARTTIIDGGLVNSVVIIPNGPRVSLSGFTIRHGSARFGAGIHNGGTLTISNFTVSANIASDSGGGIENGGTLTIKNSTVSGNIANASCNRPPLVVCIGLGGGILNQAKITIINSTITGNQSLRGGAIYNRGALTISNTTIAENSVTTGSTGNGGIVSANSSGAATATLQNSIVAKNMRRNCTGTMTSFGYNLSSDGTCNFSGSGDMNYTDAMLGALQNNGGPTDTMALPSASPAVDAGNPSGCTDGLGNLLMTDQRGKPRPDTEDTGGCDIGAYEFQSAPSCTPIGGRCGPRSTPMLRRPFSPSFVLHKLDGLWGLLDELAGS
jgi:hypothetical protein